MYTSGMGPQTPEHTVCTALLKKGPEIINEYIILQDKMAYFSIISLFS